MKRTIKSESGRSMVEMLGVLAIIGVLSIGGIAGYTMAMNRFRANEAIDMANKYTSLVFAQDQTARARTGAGLAAMPTVADLGLLVGDDANGNTLPGGAVFSDATITDGQDAVLLTIQFPSEGVCQAAQNIISQAGIACDDNNTLTAIRFRQS